jgi:ABC-type hemin transport system ATPase subunit
MKFSFKEESSEMSFSWKERMLLLFKGKLIFSDEMMKHFVNHLSRVVYEFNIRVDKKYKDQITFKNTEVKSK